MAERRFEQNILLPYINEIELECVSEDKYDFYFTNVSPGLQFRVHPSTNDMQLTMTHADIDFPLEFLFDISFLYRNTSPTHKADLLQAEKDLYNFLVKERKFPHSLTSLRAHTHSKTLLADDYIKDSEVYNLVKRTWIGERFRIMANFKDDLEQKHQAEELDLSFLLGE